MSVTNKHNIPIQYESRFWQKAGVENLSDTSQTFLPEPCVSVSTMLGHCVLTDNDDHWEAGKTCSEHYILYHFEQNGLSRWANCDYRWHVKLKFDCIPGFCNFYYAPFVIFIFHPVYEILLFCMLTFIERNTCANLGLCPSIHHH